MNLKKHIDLLLLFAIPAFSVLTCAFVDGVYYPLALVIGYVLFLSFEFLFYGLAGNFSAGYSISTLIASVLSFINYSKIKINGTPLKLNELSMAQSLDEIAGFALPQIKITLFLVIVFVLFISSAAVLAIGERHIAKDKNIRRYSLIAGVVLIFILFLPPSSGAISKIFATSRYSSEEMTVSYGTSGGLYLSYAQDNEFSGLDETEVLKIKADSIKKRKTKVSDVTPNVIFLMSESFFDVTRMDNVKFSKDPIPNYHALSESFSSGHFISSTYCGGTGYVEMEVLTGLCSNYLKNSDDLTSLEKDVYSSVPCISDVFLERGYELTFLHSYNSELFNRPAIYEAFGFHNILFEEDFPPDAELEGGCISDSALADKIINLYETKKDKPMMLFSVSMENHQPYMDYKYDTKSGIEIKADKLSKDQMGIFETYIHGLNDADKALGRLVSYFEVTDEPTVIVFWGDHLPNLNTDGGSVYETLGYSDGGNTAKWKAETLLNMVSTDYVIWDNMGLAKKDTAIGSSMLGLEVLNRLNLGLTDYFSFLDVHIKPNYIVHRPRLFVPNETEAYSYVPEEYKAMSKDYSAAVRDIVYGDNKLFKSNRKNNRK